MGGSTQSFKMAEKACTLRTRKFMTNRLLARRQFVSWAQDGMQARATQDGAFTDRPCRLGSLCAGPGCAAPRPCERPQGACWPGGGESLGACGPARARPLYRAQGIERTYNSGSSDLSVSQTELRSRLAKMYGAKDDKLVSVFGLRTQVRARSGVRGKTCALDTGGDARSQGAAYQRLGPRRPREADGLTGRGSTGSCPRRSHP